MSVRITLRDAMPEDRTIYVTDESVGEVQERVNAALSNPERAQMLTFERVVGMRRIDFATHAENIVNIEEF